MHSPSSQVLFLCRLSYFYVFCAKHHYPTQKGPRNPKKLVLAPKNEYKEQFFDYFG